MPFVTSLHPLQRKLCFMWIKNNYTLFHLPCFKHLDIALILSSLRMKFEPLQTLSLLIMCKYSSPRTFYVWFLQDQKQPKTKEQSYQHSHSKDIFILLSIESFGCLQNQVDDFLQLYANNVWGNEMPQQSFAFVLTTYFRQRVSIAFQKLQASTILN